MLYQVIRCYTMLRDVLRCFTTLYILCCTMWNGFKRFYTMLYYVIRCSTTLNDVILCYTMLFDVLLISLWISKKKHYNYIHILWLLFDCYSSTLPHEFHQHRSGRCAPLRHPTCICCGATRGISTKPPLPGSCWWFPVDFRNMIKCISVSNLLCVSHFAVNMSTC